MRFFRPKIDYKSYIIPTITIIISVLILVASVVIELFIKNEWLILSFTVIHILAPMIIFRSIVEIMYARDNRKKQ